MKSIFKTSLLVSSLSFLALASSAPHASAQPKRAMATKPSIVLVHGAFADGSSWERVIPLLQRDGYTVTAVQNTLTSFPADVATTKRVIDAQKGSVIVVGHSYGGAVITEAAAGNPHVKGLVYIAALVPDAGEPVAGLLGKFAAAPLAADIAPDKAGFLYLNRAKFRSDFCADLPVSQANVMAATQKPLAAAAFSQKVTKAAWKTIPSWYLVCLDDRAINPQLEKFMAKRIGARTTQIKSSHVPFLSHPGAVAKIIETAAKAPVK